MKVKFNNKCKMCGSYILLGEFCDSFCKSYYHYLKKQQEFDNK